MAKRILHLDDDAGEAALLRLLLDRIPGLDFALVHFDSPDDAIAALRREEFHCVFLDHRVAGVDAQVLIHRLRDTKCERPVLLLTGQRDPAAAVRLVQAGADEYLEKGKLSVAALSEAMDRSETRWLRRRMESDLKRKALRLSDMLERESLALRELEVSMERVEAANRAKTTFLANMSHEIRTPLTAILGYSEELRDGGLDPERGAEAIRIIHQNGEFLLQIVNDILDLSKIEAGRLEVERSRFAPLTTVADVCGMMEVKSRAKGIDLEFRAEGEVPETVLSDPMRFRQVLVNLLGNAIKFTLSGRIAVTLRLLPPGAGVGEAPTGDASIVVAGDERRIELEVEDTGIGMSPAQVARIFEAFSQGDSSTTRKFGGTGLGLTIVDRLVRMLGGRVEVRSEAGRGSTFRASFAAGPLDGIGMLTDEKGVGRDPSSHEVPAPLRIPDCRILLADDNPVNRKLISGVLERMGARVLRAENGAMAVESVVRSQEEGRPVDLVLMDLQMPELDGLGATRKLRELGCDRPIIALTGNAMESDRQMCLEAGFDDYASKPIRKSRLVEVINRHLGSRRPAPAASIAGSGRGPAREA